MFFMVTNYFLGGNEKMKKLLKKAVAGVIAGAMLMTATSVFAAAPVPTRNNAGGAGYTIDLSGLLNVTSERVKFPVHWPDQHGEENYVYQDININYVAEGSSFRIETHDGHDYILLMHPLNGDPSWYIPTRDFNFHDRNELGGVGFNFYDEGVLLDSRWTINSMPAEGIFGITHDYVEHFQDVFNSKEQRGEYYYIRATMIRDTGQPWEHLEGWQRPEDTFYFAFRAADAAIATNSQRFVTIADTPIRTEPSANAKIVGTSGPIPANTTIGIMYRHDEDWYRVPGGYASAHLIKQVVPYGTQASPAGHMAQSGGQSYAPAAVATKTVTVPGLNVRSGAGTAHSIVGVLRGGDTVSVLGTSGGWSRINHNGATAYVYDGYLR